MENLDKRFEANSNFIFNFHVRLLHHNKKTGSCEWGKEQIQIAYIAGPHACEKNRLIEELLACHLPEDISIDYKLTWEALLHEAVNAETQLMQQGYRHYDDELEFKTGEKIYVPEHSVIGGKHAINKLIVKQSKVGLLHWTRPEDIRRVYEAYTNGREVVHAEHEFIRDHWWV